MKVIQLCITVFQLLAVALPIHSEAREANSMFVYTRFRGGLDPAKVLNPFEESILRCTFQGLVKLDGAGRITGDLAKSWKISEDKTKVEFKLKPATFADGTILSASDVVRSFKRLALSDATYLQKQILLDLIDSKSNWVSSSDSSTVTIKLKRPYAPLLTFLTSFEFLVVPSAAEDGTFRNGSTSYRVEVLKQNEEFVISKLGALEASEKISAKVSYDLPTAENALKSGTYDLIVAIPNYFASTFKPINSSYQLVTANRYTPYLFEFDIKKKVFEKLSFRRDLKSVIHRIAKESIGENDTFFKVTHNLVPPGLLLPEYYLKAPPLGMSIDSFVAKWRSHIEKNGLSIWIPKLFLPEPFIEALKSKLAEKIPNLKIYNGPFAEVKELFARNEIDVSTQDPSSYFADPDSFLHLWKSNRAPFPFSGEKMMAELKKARHLVDSKKRLTQYARIIENFENEAWVVPIYQTRYPIFKKKDVETPDINLTTFNLLCP